MMGTFDNGYVRVPLVWIFVTDFYLLKIVFYVKKNVEGEKNLCIENLRHGLLLIKCSQNLRILYLGKDSSTLILVNSRLPRLNFAHIANNPWIS